MSDTEFQYERIIRQHFDVRSTSGREAMAMCPWHDNTRSPSLQMNLQTGFYNCFNASCGARGGPTLLSRYIGLPLESEEVSVAHVRARLDALATQTGDEDGQKLSLDESMLQRYLNDSAYWGPCPEDCRFHEARRCKFHRRFSPVTTAAFDLGHDYSTGCDTIPIRNRRGEFLGVIKRDPSPDPAMRYEYPYKFKRKLDMFASWLCEESTSDQLVITEGSIDAIRGWETGFTTAAIYGSSISPEQVRMIKRWGFTRVCLFFDNDAAGKSAESLALGWKRKVLMRQERDLFRRNREVRDEKWSYDEATDLRQHFLVSVASYKDTDATDPGETNTEEFTAAVVNARSLMPER